MDPLKEVLLSGAADVFTGSNFRVLDAHGRLNANAMRPFVNKKGESRIVHMNANGQLGTIVTNAPALLQYDEWKDIDRRVIRAGTDRLVGIADLISRGLTHNLGSIGKTISLWDRESDMTPANVDMSGVTAGEEDKIAYLNQSVPVPIIHKDFRVNIRHLMASRLHGESIDTTMAAVAGRVVAEKSEEMLFTGNAIKVEGATIYGYTTHPDRNTVDLAVNWSAIAPADNDDIVTDVQAMMAASRADKKFGPWILYIPTGYEGKMDQDYRASDNRTLRQRLLGLQGLTDIKVADKLPANNVILVELQPDTVDLAIAQDITTVQWSVMGGMQERFKVMAVWVPRIKSTYNGQSGIVHLRPA